MKLPKFLYKIVNKVETVKRDWIKSPTRFSMRILDIFWDSVGFKIKGYDTCQNKYGHPCTPSCL